MFIASELLRRALGKQWRKQRRKQREIQQSFLRRITIRSSNFSKNALPDSASFVEVFEKARRDVAKREEAEDYEQSQPQISKPAAVLAALKRWHA